MAVWTLLEVDQTGLDFKESLSHITLSCLALLHPSLLPTVRQDVLWTDMDPGATGAPHQRLPLRAWPEDERSSFQVMKCPGSLCFSLSLFVFNTCLLYSGILGSILENS